MSQGKDNYVAGTPCYRVGPNAGGLVMNSVNNQLLQPTGHPAHLPLQSVKPVGPVAHHGNPTLTFPLQLSGNISQHTNSSSLLTVQNLTAPTSVIDMKKIQISGKVSNSKQTDQTPDQVSDRLSAVSCESSINVLSQERPRKTPLQIKIQGVPGTIPIQRAMQIANSSNAGLQIPTCGANVQIVGTVNTGQVHKSGLQSIPFASQMQPTTSSSKAVPQMIYIQTSTGLKPVPATDIVPANTVRLPKSSAAVQLMSSMNSKPIKSINKSILAGSLSQSFVIQKSTALPEKLTPISLTNSNSNAGGKHTFATFVSAIKKPPSVAKPQDNQKVIITPMNVPNIHNKGMFSSIASKAPYNFQIANGQIQNDPQGNVTVMQDTVVNSSSSIPPLQPITTVDSVTNQSTTISNVILDGKSSDNSFTTSIPGSRAELIGEQEYALSIPENNCIGDDVIALSISDEIEEDQGASYTINIPGNDESRIDNGTVIECTQQILSSNVPNILKRSNSDENEQADTRRITLQANDKNADDIENKIEKAKKKLFNKSYSILNKPIEEKVDDIQVQSLYCEEKLEQEQETRVSGSQTVQRGVDVSILPAIPQIVKDRRKSRVSSDMYLQCEPIMDKEISVDEDSLGLQWHDDVALLRGSQLQFRTNEFGLIDVIDSANDMISSSRYHTPLKQRLARDGAKKATSPEDLYCCNGCGCHGMAAEFITPNFCSHTCQANYDKNSVKEKAAVDSKKKRKPRKSLLIKADSKEQDDCYNIGKLSAKEKSSLDCLSSDITVKVMPSETSDQRNPTKSSKWKHENGFIWNVYLDYCKAIHAPEKLFKTSTTFKHGFKSGMKVEALDPVHQSFITVVTVAEVQGFRLKLHFDGYHENYDYWVNADSPDIFPPGWCEKNGKTLIPPRGYSQSTFSWAQYVKQTKAILAPRYLFAHLTAVNNCPPVIKVGMKLEAEDRKNSLTCVATIADIMDSRVLVHFDSWDDIYDYWAYLSSPYIHPVGWCDKNGYSLTPPNTYKDPEIFSWDAYLKETKSVPVPARVLKPRTPHGFKVGMKLEAVDKRVAFLIRVATISDVRAHQIRISFDALPDELSFWVDDDSPDIHQVGWCLNTGHPLEPPLTSEETKIPGPCGTKGCQGLGNALGAKLKTHTVAAECPYQLPPRAHELPDRLESILPPPRHSEPRSREPKRIQRGRPPKYKIRDNEDKLETASDDDSSNSTLKKRKRAISPMSQETVERSVFEPGYTPNPNWNAPPTWGLASHSMPLDDILQRLSLRTDPRNWSQTDVQEFVEKIAKSREVSWRFCKQRIDGESFLMLAQEDLVSVLGMRLGPAIKIYNSIIQLRKKIVV